jgi:hypothetical protein
VNEVLKVGILNEHLVSDFKSVGLSLNEEGVTGYHLKLECTAYTTDVTLQYNGEALSCRLIGRNRTVIDDGQVSSKLFNAILDLHIDPHNVGAIEQAANYPIAASMIDELASGASVTNLSDVKTSAVSLDQAHKFVGSRQRAFDPQKRVMRKIDPKTLSVCTLDYFLRLLPLMFIAMVYSFNNPRGQKGSGIWSLVTGDATPLMAGLKHYLDFFPMEQPCICWVPSDS